MATHQVLAVRDRATDSFGQPIFVVAVGVAVRSFTDEVNRKESPFNAHPEDYDLYHLAEYEDRQGQIQPFSTPRLVSIGKDLLRSSE